MHFKMQNKEGLGFHKISQLPLVLTAIKTVESSSGYHWSRITNQHRQKQMPWLKLVRYHAGLSFCLNYVFPEEGKVPYSKQYKSSRHLRTTYLMVRF